VIREQLFELAVIAAWCVACGWFAHAVLRGAR
jgi:hypothetical protein